MPETQYCQNFMIQVEQSTFDKIAAKEVNWNSQTLKKTVYMICASQWKILICSV